MRIQSLNLSNFGPFTNTQLNFTTTDDCNHGLHLVYGQNEVGKSSALRGIIALLYGFDKNTSDNFLHPNNELQVAGKLIHSDGSILEMRRRKGIKNTLLNLDGQPLNELALNRFLGSINKQSFQAVFGIDHVRLKEGGQAILAGNGNIGEALFAASTGITKLRQLVENLQTEAGELFKPNGKNQKVAILKRQYEEIRRDRETLTIRGADWQRHDTELRYATIQAAQLNQDITALRNEKIRIERIAQAIPYIALYQELTQRLDKFKDTKLLSSDFTARRTQAWEMLEHSKQELEIRAFELNRIETELQQIVVNTKIMEVGATIERLSKQSGQFDKANADLSELQMHVREYERIALNLLQDIRPDLTLAEAEIKLRLSKSQRNGIRELGNRFGAIDNNCKQALANKSSAVIEIAKRHQAMQRFGNVLDSANIPTLDTISKFQEEFTALAHQRKSLTEQLSVANTDLAKCSRQLKALNWEGEALSVATLEQARIKRDTGWQLIRQTLLQQARDIAAETAFDPNRPLLEAYEYRVKLADDVADRLRREATKVQQQIQLQADCDYYRNNIAKLQQDISNIQSQQFKLEKSWYDLWNTVGINPLNPREMQNWWQQRNQLITNINEWKQQLIVAEQAIALATHELEVWRNQWATAIQMLGLDVTATPAQANTALDQIDEMFKALKTAADIREQINVINQDTITYEQKIVNLSQQIAPDLATQPPLIAINKLYEQLQEARNLASKRDVLMQQATKERNRIITIKLQQHQAQIKLNACLQEAHCDDYFELSELEIRSMQRYNVETEYAACRQRLLELSNNKGEVALFAEAAQLNKDELPNYLETISHKIELLEQKQAELNQTIGDKRAVLRNMDGRGDAADKATELEQVLAELRSASERYLRLRLANMALEQYIETYRQHNQTPLLKRASEIFARITNGGFHGLETTFNTDDVQVLCGLRSNNQIVLVEHMSDGTRDQLFLALRLASIETYLTFNEPMPLIVDDIMINYDDIRSSQTLKVLAELAQRTQVIIFTHHRHLLDLARTSLNEISMWVQEILPVFTTA
jgi:uncharacterized protein YhaN